MASLYDEKKKREERFKTKSMATGPIDDDRPQILRAGERTQNKVAKGESLTPATPTVSLNDTPLKRRFKQRVTELDSFPDTFGSMYVKDPTTGKNIPREGYRNEAGTFIPGPRVRPHQLGTLINYATTNVKDPRIREIIAESIGRQAGVLDPETGRVGSELARTGEQILEGIKGRYRESVANIGAKAGVEAARIGARGEVESSAIRARALNRASYTPKGYAAASDVMGNTRIYSKDTGQFLPEEGPSVELTPEVKAAIDKIRNNPEKVKRFYLDNPDLRSGIRAYLEGGVR